MSPPADPERWERAPGALWRRCATCTLVLAGDQLHDLLPPGDLVWEHLSEAASVDDLTSALVARRVGDPARIRDEVHDLIGQLVAVGAVQRSTP